MGTSLSGLTPATTFDGLLKVGDNDPLDGTLKTIGTGDGTDSVLQLSNSALQVNGAATINGGQATIVGAGNDAATTALLVQNSDGDNILKIDNSSAIEVISGVFRVRKASNNAQIFYVSETYNASAQKTMINSLSNPDASLHVKGSGTTSATTSLLVQNSDGDDSLYVKDALEWGIGHGSANRIDGNNNNLYIRHNQLFFMTGGNYFAKLTTAGFQVGNGAGTPTARLQVKGSGTTSATTALLVQNSGGSNIIKANDDGRVLLGVNTDYQNHLLELNGEGLGDSQTLLRLQSSVNFMGAYTGIGFTNSSNGSSLSSEIRAYRESYGNAMTFNFAGTEMLRATSEGNLGIGETTPTARLHVKGSGNDNTTTSLLVQNSDGDDLFKIDDNGAIDFGLPNATQSLRIANIGSSTIAFSGPSNLTMYATTLRLAASVNAAYTGSQTFNIGADSNLGARLGVKGSGNDGTTTALLVQNSDGDELFKVDDLATITLGRLDAATGGILVRGEQNEIRSNILYYRAKTGGYLGRFDSNGFQIGNGATGAAAKLQVKGSGTTSATTSLLVQNSAGTDLFWARDDNTIRFSLYYAKTTAIHPTGAQDLGINNVAQWHFGNIYSKGVTHITDNTTSSTTLDASAKLQVDSTTQGLLPPRMRTGEKNAITSPAPGLMVYDTDANQMSYWNGGAWINF